MKIKQFNTVFSTQQNFLYGMLVLTWRHVTHRLADISGLHHMQPEDLTSGVRQLCECAEIVHGIESLVEDGVRMNSLRTYMVALKASAKTEDSRRIFNEFRHYLESSVGVSNTQAGIILHSIFSLVCASTLEEYSTLSHVSGTFQKTQGVRLRRK